MISSNSRAQIYVNGRFLSQRITGVQRYAHELLTAIDALLSTRAIEPVPMTVLIPPDSKNLPSWPSLRIHQAGRFTGQLWEQLDLPFHARGNLLFTPCGGAPIAHKRQVVTIHDAGPFSTPQAYTLAYRSYYKILEKILARKAVHLITDSEFSRQELIRYLRVPERKISRVWLSGDHILRFDRDDAVLERYGLLSGKYILAVGSRNPNKNLHGLMRAYAHLPASEVCLAIVGGSNSTIFARSPDLADSVMELGFVEDADLRTLYEHAACFVFPSFYEGFGIPPLEALTLGTPVIVSRAASLPEIFGEAATYCDPHSPEDIARQISRVLQNKTPHREAAMLHASRFTWERCARQTWDVLLQALDLTIGQ
jgi:glycosyltransferase involved in cell wall biosynthesis